MEEEAKREEGGRRGKEGGGKEGGAPGGGCSSRSQVKACRGNQTCFAEQCACHSEKNPRTKVG